MNNLGNSFKEKMVEQTKKFEKWASLTTMILKNNQEFKNGSSILSELDAALEDLKTANKQLIIEQKDKGCMKVVEVIQIDLTKGDFDLSEWDEDVRPAKAFVAIEVCDGDNHLELTFKTSDIVFLMKDGTFKKNLA